MSGISIGGKRPLEFSVPPLNVSHTFSIFLSLQFIHCIVVELLLVRLLIWTVRSLCKISEW